MRDVGCACVHAGIVVREVGGVEQAGDVCACACAVGAECADVEAVEVVVGDGAVDALELGLLAGRRGVGVGEGEGDYLHRLGGWWVLARTRGQARSRLCRRWHSHVRKSDVVHTHDVQRRWDRLVPRLVKLWIDSLVAPDDGAQ